MLENPALKQKFVKILINQNVCHEHELLIESNCFFLQLITRNFPLPPQSPCDAHRNINLIDAIESH